MQDYGLLARLLSITGLCSVATGRPFEKHEIERKHGAGMHGTARGRTIAGVDAAGASLGSVGLMIFGLIGWQLLPHWPAWLVLAIAAMAWFAVSLAAWWLRKLM